MDTIFLNDWTLKDWKDRLGLEALKNDFEINDEHLRGVNILLASYGCANYEGAAFVLFEKDKKLFEVNAYHCSCYGLENQWEPEETTVEALRHRLVSGELGRDNYSGNEFADELSSCLTKLTQGG